MSQFINALCARRRGQQQRTSGVREVVLRQVGVRASCRSRMPVTGCADVVGHEATCNAVKATAAECARGELTGSMLVTESPIVTLVRLVHP